MSFMSNVISELKYQGKTQTELANHLGLKKGAITAWIARDSVPAADVAQKVADYLNVPLRYLLTGEGKDSGGDRSGDFIDISPLAPGDKGNLREICGKFPQISEESKEDVVTLVRKAFERKNKVNGLERQA